MGRWLACTVITEYWVAKFAHVYGYSKLTNKPDTHTGIYFVAYLCIFSPLSRLGKKKTKCIKDVLLISAFLPTTFWCLVYLFVFPNIWLREHLFSSKKRKKNDSESPAIVSVSKLVLQIQIDWPQGCQNVGEKPALWRWQSTDNGWILNSFSRAMFGTTGFCGMVMNNCMYITIPSLPRRIDLRTALRNHGKTVEQVREKWPLL